MAKWFIQVYYQQHALPLAVVSDRGRQFVGMLWTRVCTLLGIKRRLSTVYYLETDGSTERINQTLETYLRMFVDFAQDDWFNAILSAEVAINNRDAASTGVSLFFLTYSYYVKHLDLDLDAETTTTATATACSPVQKADTIIRKL